MTPDMTPDDYLCPVRYGFDRGDMFVHLFVCLSISKITYKVMSGSARNFLPEVCLRPIY